MSDLHAPQATRRAARSRRRGSAVLAAAALLLAVVPFAAACGAGFTSNSQIVRPNAGAGITGSLRVNNVWVVVDPESGQAQVIGAVVNTGDTADQVVAVQAEGVPAQAAGPAATGAAANGVIVCARTAIVGGAVVIRPHQSVNFGQPGCPRLLLTAGTQLRPGRMVPVTLTFAQAAPLSFNVQIVSATGLFAEYKVPRVVTILPVSASNQAGSSAGASGSATPSASGGASASATPSATP